ncbi:MAG: TspO/MBR family protein [Solibacillus sp.]|uniref:TspO/MBR family protein n=1 Tax=unclassified Solibacillus TaxID=2637870 RepID=UPI0030F72057
MGQYVLMWLSFIAMIVVNILSETLPINGQTTAEISHRLDVYFTPAGYVFSIWTLIYILLAIWLVLQYKKVKTGEFNSKIGWLFILSCLFNIGWLYTWHYEQFIWSMILMFLLLFTLIGIYLQYSPSESKLSQRLPFSFYLAWISVATIANMSYVLKYYDVSLGIPEVLGSLILVVIASTLAYMALVNSMDPIFVLVIVWALIGIAVKTTNEAMEYGTLIVTALLVVASLLTWGFHKKNHTKSKG